MVSTKPLMKGFRKKMSVKSNGKLKEQRGKEEEKRLNSHDGEKREGKTYIPTTRV